MDSSDGGAFVEPFDGVNVFDGEFGAPPYGEFFDQSDGKGVRAAGEFIVESDEGHWAVVVAEVDCFAQAVDAKPVSQLPERVGFGGEDDEGADVVGAFSHQGCDCVVDEHAWLEGDKHEVTDWFLVC